MLMRSAIGPLSEKWKNITTRRCFCGALLQATVVALQKAGELPHIMQRDYEPRSFFMGISFQAVWFDQKADDIFIPLSPNFGIGKAYQPESESEMIKLFKLEVQNGSKRKPHRLDRT